MFNQVILMGRITREPEVRYIAGTDNAVVNFSLAVDRDYKEAGEERAKTDFINCEAWNKTGEFIGKYFTKGSLILITGTIKTGSYTGQDGKKVYTTTVRVTKASFTGEKRGNAEPPAAAPEVNSDGFMNIPDGIDEETPFN